jgi:predicted dinucleotide-binding enzyme
MRIAFIGYGNVGAPLADQLQRLGHEVTLAARDAASPAVQQALARNPALQVAGQAEAIARAELVFVATPFSVATTLLPTLAEALAGKVVVDCTNPVGPGLSHGLDSRQSGTALLQQALPASRLVKAFTIYGYENFDNNAYPGYNVQPVMMYCGEEATAKTLVAGLIAQLGWQPLDVGGLAQALHLEHMTLLWIRMVRAGGQSPHRVWATLTR